MMPDLVEYGAPEAEVSQRLMRALQTAWFRISTGACGPTELELVTQAGPRGPRALDEVARGAGQAQEFRGGTHGAQSVHRPGRRRQEAVLPGRLSACSGECDAGPRGSSENGGRCS